MENKKVLLIDDETSLRRSLTLGLNQKGYEVEPCENGISALNKLEELANTDNNMDSIIIDINLPDIDGIKLGEMINQKYPDSQLVYITGYASTIEQNQIKELKAKAFLEKPFSVDELSTTLENIDLQKTEKVAEQKSISAYMLLKFAEGADIFEIYRQLYFMEDVLFCDATKGEYDVFMLVQSNSTQSCRDIYENKIKTISGISEIEFLNIENPTKVENDEIGSAIKERDFQNHVSSYVIIEAEQDKRDIISSQLRNNDNVVYCDNTKGKYNLIMLTFGSQFSEIDKFIENNVSNIEGVLKVKEYPIINMFEM